MKTPLPRIFIHIAGYCAFFGFGKIDEVDSVLVHWPGGKFQWLTHVKADQLLTVNIKDAHHTYYFKKNIMAKDNLFTEVTDSLGLNFTAPGKRLYRF